MLQSFIGTFDGTRLRTLRSEDGVAAPWYLLESEELEFWAIIDSDEVVPIEYALTLGHGDLAMQLLGQTAKSLGPTNR